MNLERRATIEPFFSICIPQHNRTSFLLECLRSIASQTCRDVEVCISDDCSTDGRQSEVQDFLQSSELSFVYHTQTQNSRYDGNLRQAISLARGRFCFLLGNDDALAGSDSLVRLRQDMEANGPAGVVIADFEDFVSGQRALRIRETRNYGAGPDVAAGHYRNFSFVSGVVLERRAAHAAASSKWDGSEMYQTFVGCRLIASGLSLLELDRSVIRKDIQIPGMKVDSYSTRPPAKEVGIVERRLPLSMLGRVVIDAVEPHIADPWQRTRIAERVLLQLLLFTYPFWIVEYRRVRSWRFAAGVCLGMRPKVVAEGVRLGWFRRLRVYAAYCFMTACGLLAPLGLFRRFQSFFYRIAKSVYR